MAAGTAHNTEQITKFRLDISNWHMAKQNIENNDSIQSIPSAILCSRQNSNRDQFRRPKIVSKEHGLKITSN